MDNEIGDIYLPQWVGLLQREVRETAAKGAAAGPRSSRIALFQAAHEEELFTFGPRQQNIAFFEGYLYDRDQLIAALDLPAKASTLQIIAQAYTNWGTEMYDRLDGAYLAAVWDEERKRFVIGHDCLSRHPVYYAETGEGIWFASNLRALVRSGAVDTDLNRLTLARRLILKHPLAGQTAFSSIQRLLPASYLLYHADGRTSQHQYWQLIPQNEVVYYSEERVLDEYQEVLQRAVNRRMALGGDAVLLSGGVDSITVAILAAGYARRNALSPVAAASIAPVPGYPLDNEARLQEPVARRLGMPFVRRDTRQLLGGETLLWQSLRELEQLPAPDRIYWMGGYVGFYDILREMGYRTLLSGSGGDEWLGVHGAIAADYVRSLSLVKLLRLAQLRRRDESLSYREAAKAVFWQAGIKRHLASYQALLFPHRWAEEAHRLVEVQIPPWLNLDPELREALFTTMTDSFTHPLSGEGKKPRSYYWHALAATYQNSHMTYENERDFHIHRKAGIRVLSPFHDRQAIRFFQHIDPQTLLYSHRNKGLLRNFAAQQLPGLGVERQEKTYFGQGRSASFANDSLLEQAGEVGKSIGITRLERINLVKNEEYRHALANSGSFSLQTMVYLFTVSALEVWLRGLDL
jgi:asparagine synthetase B (glutamine-hydrolysing)